VILSKSLHGDLLPTSSAVVEAAEVEGAVRVARRAVGG